MKRLILALIAIFMLQAAAQAEDLPDAVQRLCADAYPGYAVLTMDGYDDGITGRWAVVLHKDGDNSLVLAERSEGSGYSLTVNNPNAVPDEGEGYSKQTHTVNVALTKEMRNDCLAFLKLTIEQPGDTSWVITSELQSDGAMWSSVISEYTFFDWDGRTVWWSHVFAEDGSINYMRHQEDRQGKPLSTTTYPRLPVGGESASANLLECFDAGTYPYMPDLINGECIEDYAKEFVPSGDKLIQLDLQAGALILLVESPQGVRTLRILPHENWQFRDAIVTGPLPGHAGFDTFHAGEGVLQVEWFDGGKEYSFCFAQRALNLWAPSWLMVNSTTYRFTYNSIACTEDVTSPMRSDGVHYGNHPWQMIEQIDFGAIPSTKEALLLTVDQSGYAVVNNPNPEDRLHLREMPRTDARSLGKFYNRTPVCVHAIEDEWAHVSIGSISGWMMTKYLAFGEEMDGVGCAFPQMFIREEIGSLPLQPWKTGKTVAHIDGETAFYIVGVEEERYVILTEDGKTGYVKQSHFYPGNG